MLTKKQLEVCGRFGVEPLESMPWQKVGIAENVRTGLNPINGLRHPPEGDVTGWYIWAGTEFSNDPKFFKALHVAHVKDWCPIIETYLGLPPGWRFLITDDYEDVWFDESLLKPT